MHSGLRRNLVPIVVHADVPTDLGLDIPSHYLAMLAYM